MYRQVFLFFTLLVSQFVLYAQDIPKSQQLWPNLEGQIGRPLRYTTEGTDFVITNGKEFFNRPLYGGNTAFRVDAGDLPEFVLYLPGRGGNLRFGIRKGQKAIWLHELMQIKAIYRPGSMVYEIRDPEILGQQGLLQLNAIATYDMEGFVLRLKAVELSESLELFWAYGGVNGQRGIRDGDIGTEKVPISQWFQLQPAFAEGNKYQIEGAAFTLVSKPGVIIGAFPTGSILDLRDAHDWNAIEKLLNEPAKSTDYVTPVLVGKMAIKSGDIHHIGLQYIRVNEIAADHIIDEVSDQKQISANNLASIFEKAGEQRASIAGQLRVHTPDPYLNAAVPALCIAADAVWDESQGAVMHGAIAWRRKLLGWRGPYAMDALGWHDRAQRHLAYWTTRQNTDPVPDKHAPPEEATNLARMRTALHTNGDMANSHYDMNLVYIDALFRYLMWTGDLTFAEEVWPVIERHLAWERRSFRREYGPDKLPLYEAYAAIWASDDLQYHGSGVAYTSAYNYWHNTQAARLAELLGQDGSFYENEAKLIARAMREILWMPEAGMFAEYKDLLGNQLVHTESGLWTFYHILDAELPNSKEALSMTQWIDGHIPHLPVYGPGLPDNETRYVLSTTSWMPYSWSVNNVTMNENIHTALAYWKAGRQEEAFRLTQSSLLASMFMGICPGNIGSMNYLDVYRRESQRDFADGSGVFSRALVEGLFGVRPDLLGRKLIFAPGFPNGWEQASLEHPDIDVIFERNASVDHYTIRTRFPVNVRFTGHLPALYEKALVKINGQNVLSHVDAKAAVPMLNFETPAGNEWEIIVEWMGKVIQTPVYAATWPEYEDTFIPGISGIEWNQPISSDHQIESINLTDFYNDRITNIFEFGKYRSPRSPGVSLSIPAQGLGAWAGHVNAMAEIDDSGIRSLGGQLKLPNGIYFTTPEKESEPNVVFVSQWDNYPNELTIPLNEKAQRIFLLMAGSTNHMQSRIENGVITVHYSDGTETRLSLVNPTNWWPIDQDYFIDDYQFRRPGPLPPRVDMKTGNVRFLEYESFLGKGGTVEGGAATILTLPLEPSKTLKSISIEARANEVIIGLLGVTLIR